MMMSRDFGNTRYWLCLADAARYVGRSTHTVERWRRAGLLDIRDTGAEVLYAAPSLYACLLRMNLRKHHRPPSSAAAQWLYAYLADHDGRARSADAKHAARAAGFPERTLVTAARRLGLRMRSVGFPRITIWELRTQQPPEPRSTPATNTNITGATGEIHRKLATDL